jgi:peptidoglycan-N-acetylglucosamine deacetylase
MLLLVLIGVIVCCGFVYWFFMSSYSQFFGHFPWRGKTQDKIVALTFDDGPNEPYTSEIVDFLNRRGVKATFFQVGSCVEKYPGTTKKIIESGHVVGNHSLSHAFHTYVTHPSFYDEITKTQAIIKKHTGKTPALFRPPWLWRQPLLMRTLHRCGLTPVSGEFCHSLEVFQIDGRRIARATLRKMRPGSILIFHDGFDARGGNRAQTVQAVKITVDQLLKEGWKFATLDSLLGVKAYND